MSEDEIQRGTAITTAEYNKLKEKADAFDFLFGEEGIKTGNVMKLWVWRNKLESVREFVLSRKYDIEMDVENFGMLKPVLNYFLEESVVE